MIVGLSALLRKFGLPSGTRRPAAPQSTSSIGDDAHIERLFRAHESDAIVTITGRVTRLLPPDNDGKPHQRFVVELDSRRTLLVAHNLSVSQPVPLRRGDRVRVHGEYEWNDRGGLIHWTHHDPEGWREGGWIEHDGRRFE